MEVSAWSFRSTGSSDVNNKWRTSTRREWATPWIPFDARSLTSTLRKAMGLHIKNFDFLINQHSN